MKKYNQWNDFFVANTNTAQRDLVSIALSKNLLLILSLIHFIWS